MASNKESGESILDLTLDLEKMFDATETDMVRDCAHFSLSARRVVKGVSIEVKYLGLTIVVVRNCNERVFSHSSVY